MRLVPDEVQTKSSIYEVATNKPVISKLLAMGIAEVYTENLFMASKANLNKRCHQDMHVAR